MHGTVLPSTRASAPITTTSRMTTGAISTFVAAEKENKIKGRKRKRRKKQQQQGQNEKFIV